MQKKYRSIGFFILAAMLLLISLQHPSAKLLSYAPTSEPDYKCNPIDCKNFPGPVLDVINCVYLKTDCDLGNSPGTIEYCVKDKGNKCNYVIPLELVQCLGQCKNNSTKGCTTGLHTHCVP